MISSSRDVAVRSASPMRLLRPWTISFATLASAAVLLLPPLREYWQQSGGRWAYILVISGLVSCGLTPIVVWLGWTFGVLDMPASRKVHAEPTPLLGGLAIYLAFLTSVLANSIFDAQVAAILAGGTVLVLVGVADDVFSLPAGAKLVAQLGAAAIVMHSGVVISLFSHSQPWHGMNWLLTVVWILGITNAMNFFDGMDGLATGLGIITAAFLGLFAMLTTQPYLGWFAAGLVGSCLGFLPYNYRPGRPAAVFLGDAGSTFLGFVLAALAVKGEWAESNVVDLAAPILIFWVFIFDMTYISITRIVTGKVRSFRDWIAYVGRDHLHHRLASLLGSKRQAVLLIFLFSICSGLAAIALLKAHVQEAILLIVQSILVAVIFSILERAGNR
jgi:UDP-GlcNAc:undecaprenyl-phosphate/decaprenyl-phosphate GlcNAc-1-phosphate transferase